MDLHAMWTVASDWLIKTVPGVIILGLVPNVLFLVFRRAKPGVLRQWRRGREDAEAYVRARSALLERSDRALLVECSSRVAAVTSWFAVSAGAALVWTLAPAKYVLNTMLSLVTFYGFVEGARHLRALSLLHRRYVDGPTRAAAKLVAEEEASAVKGAGAGVGPG